MPRLGREKLYFGGDTGAGKTRAWVSIAAGIPNCKFIALETDDGIFKIADELGVSCHRMVKTGNDWQINRSATINVFPTYSEWDDFYKQAEQCERWWQNRVIGPDDWLIIEGLDILGDNIKYEFAKGAYGSGTQGVTQTRAQNAHMADSSFGAFINRRRAGNPIVEPADYDGIYTELQEVVNTLVMASPCNVVATVGVQAQREGTYANTNSARLEADWYASMGMPVRFSGWWKLPRKFDTLIVFGHNVGGYNFQVFKDRGGNNRGTAVANNQIAPIKNNTNFYQDYLVNMVGWGQASSVVMPATQAAAAPVLPPSSNGSVVPPIRR